MNRKFAWRSYALFALMLLMELLLFIRICFEKPFLKTLTKCSQERYKIKLTESLLEGGYIVATLTSQILSRLRLENQMNG